MRFTGWTALSLLVLLLGVAFWLFMSVTFGNASDVGVYTVGATLIAFGLAGSLVSMAPRAA